MKRTILVAVALITITFLWPAQAARGLTVIATAFVDGGSCCNPAGEEIGMMVIKTAVEARNPEPAWFGRHANYQFLSTDRCNFFGAIVFETISTFPIVIPTGNKVPSTGYASLVCPFGVRARSAVQAFHPAFGSFADEAISVCAQPCAGSSCSPAHTH